MKKKQFYLASLPLAILIYVIMSIKVGLSGDSPSVLLQFLLLSSFLVAFLIACQCIVNSKENRPRINYLLEEGFIQFSVINGELKIDSTNCPWELDIVNNGRLAQISYMDEPYIKLTLAPKLEID